MLSEIIALLSMVPMVIYVFSKRSIIGAFSWILFALACLIKALEFLSGKDYVNVMIFSLGAIFFLLMAKAIVSRNSRAFLDVTTFSVLACAIYFPFVFIPLFNSALIELTAHLSSILGNMLGYQMNSYGAVIKLGNSSVEIILACTAIESMALFSGVILGINADLKRKLKAFLISVPVIYLLNLFRNVFVIVSFAYSIFGENSFYIAHHVIAKLFSFIALIAIVYAVFRILPELTELIYSLKEEMVRGIRGD